MQGTDEKLLALGNSLCMWSINCVKIKFVAFHVRYVHHKAGKFKLKLYRPIPEGYQKCFESNIATVRKVRYIR